MTRAAPGKDGLLELELLPDGPGHRFVRAPLSLGRILHADPQARNAQVVYIRATGGGLAQGDRVQQHISVRSGAHAVVTSQTATRIHSMNGGYASQESHLHVASGAVLEYLPDPIIPSRDCDFRQRTQVQVAPGATAIVGDCFTAGRTAHGEFHDAARIDLRVELSIGAPPAAPEVASVPTFIERASYRGKSQLSAPVTHGSYRAWANLWVVCDSSLRDAVLAAWRDYPTRSTEIVVGASSFPEGSAPGTSGCWARCMGQRIEDIAAWQWDYWDRARRIVLGVSAFDLRKM